MQASSIRLICTMGIAGCLSGLLLVGVYSVTLPAIQRHRAEALERAVLQVIPQSRAFVTLLAVDGVLTEFKGEQGEQPEGLVVYRGVDEEGNPLGFAVPAGGPGFQDNIELLYGFDPEKQIIVGMEILESSETPGLGDKIIFDKHFRSNFTALTIQPEIVAVKKGKKANANEVDCISGATISSKAVVNILNKSTRQWLPLLSSARQQGVPPPNGQETKKGF